MIIYALLIRRIRFESISGTKIYDLIYVNAKQIYSFDTIIIIYWN